jgi:hypothetical protein
VSWNSMGSPFSPNSTTSILRVVSICALRTQVVPTVDRPTLVAGPRPKAKHIRLLKKCVMTAKLVKKTDFYEAGMNAKRMTLDQPRNITTEHGLL